MDAITINETIKACIHCGICLPACPTYQVTGNEGHSPRGRLYLINDLLKARSLTLDVNSDSSNVQRLTSNSITYLDSCLECSACETVCPSGVDYINILEYARHDLGMTNYTKGLMAWLRRLAFKWLLPNRRLMNSLRVLSRFVPLGLLNKLAPRFDFEYKKIKTNYIYRSDYKDAKKVSMPLGCVMDTAYNNVHWDTIAVLNAFGYDVYIPETQCCGALAYHSGEFVLGEKQLEQTVKLLSQSEYPVVMNSAGCGAFLKNHSDLPVMDLIEVLKKGPASPSPLCYDAAARNTLQAVYHPACHLNHQQGVSQDYVDLLKQIPGLELIPLHEADLCCGSAGFYNLIQSQMANEIGKRKAENIYKACHPEDPEQSEGDVRTPLVLTANPGCMSQIQAHLGDEYKVMHPVSLIKEFLGNKTF